MSYATIAHMFDSLTRKYGQKVLIRAIEQDEVVEFTWEDVFDHAMRTAIALKQAGVHTGEQVAILSANRPHWIFADLGIMLAGAVSVPIYPSLAPDTIAHILKETQVKVVFTDTEMTALRVMARLDFLTGLQKIVIFDGTTKKDVPMCSYDDFINTSPTQSERRRLRNEYLDIGPDDIHTIIYTPGVSGYPKGVILTNQNIIANCSDAAAALPLLDTDDFMSYLDLSHAFERTGGYYTAIYVGAAINFPRSPGTIVSDMQRLKPTVMCSVPYFFSMVQPKLHAAVLKNLGSVSKFVLRMGKRASKDEFHGGSMTADIINGAMERLVYRKVRDFFGGRLRFFVSGSAPLPLETARFFHQFGILILEGYGLTEAGPIVSVNRVNRFKFGSVGIPLRNARVKIAEDGEILVQGPNVMKGYFKRPEESLRAFDRDGWLKTGDIGVLDPDGFLHITDRKKDLIKTSTGKLIAPQEIETRFLEIPYVQRAVLLGEEFASLLVVIFPAFPQLRSWARQKNIQFKDNADLAASSEVKEMFRAKVQEINSRLAPFERIGNILIVDAPIDDFQDLFTPSMRPDRKRISIRMADRIQNAMVAVSQIT